MGNDGGSIPTRRELVKEAARNPTTTELKATQAESQTYHWTTDPLSREPLHPPIVGDSNGKLYNKSSIIEFLLPAASPAEEKDKEEQDKTVLLGAVKSLKDVVQVHFDTDDTAEASANGSSSSKWRCPITGDTLGPGTKAVYLVPCGHAFSGVAIKEIAIPAEGSTCLVCEAAVAQNDVIPILPTSTEDIARLALRIKGLRERGLSHSLKKAAKDRSGEKGEKSEKSEKSKKRKAGAGAGAGAVVDQQDGEKAPQLVSLTSSKNNNNNNDNKPTSTGTSTPSNIQNTATASLTAKVLQEEQDKKTKRRRLENENLKSLFSNRDPTKPHGRSSDFMTRGFDIPAGGAKR